MPSSVTAEEAVSILKAGLYESNGRKVKLVDKPRLQKAPGAVRTIDVGHQTPLPGVKGSPTPAQVTVLHGGSFEAAAWLSARTPSIRTAVLDFASDSNPGGGWRSKQQGTQEESLCRCSNLGVCLEAHYNRVGAARYMPRPHGVVLVPDVVVFHTGKAYLDAPVWVSVVAAALRGGDTEKEEFCRKRVRDVLAVAASAGCRAVVLGAWGCGAFGNDAEKVAEAFRLELRRMPGVFDDVVFAIPNKRSHPNVAAFLQAFPEAATV
eukprot:TRINITY_DN22962_c0_g2_i1.p2 TRINITY_DN22962_c0_g2~~TRINITY_DN22962_c0_g2_i1.p2  ORF type:complete len:264 (+),score=68.93 TRINITY_DN22962_c0_g2_i1:165-956(+)